MIITLQDKNFSVDANFLKHPPQYRLKHFHTSTGQTFQKIGWSLVFFGIF